MNRNLTLVLLCLLLLMASFCPAQADFPIILSWPDDQPTLKFVFGKYQQSGIVDGQGIFVSDVTVQNLSHQTVPHSVFTVFVSDKNGVRIGRGLLRLPEIASKRSEKAQLQFSVAGTPVGLKLLSGRTIPLKVVSVPPGAALKVDRQDYGMTPIVVDFTIGMHTLDLNKEGYAPGNTPLEVTADELPGGSVTFELGGMSRDTVELRDGTTLLGDVLSMSLDTMVVRVDGKDQKYDRNQVKKLFLVQRVVSEQPAVTSPAAASHP